MIEFSARCGGCEAQWPEIPIIGFPRGGNGVSDFCGKDRCNRCLLDRLCPLMGHATLPAGMPVQGNIDPVYLLTGGDGMLQSVDRIVDACRDRPIFNLGHGVDKTLIQKRWHNWSRIYGKLNKQVYIKNNEENCGNIV